MDEMDESFPEYFKKLKLHSKTMWEVSVSITVIGLFRKCVKLKGL